MFKPSDVWRWLFGDDKDDSGHWLGLLIIILILFLLFGCESCESFLNGRSAEEGTPQEMQEDKSEDGEQMQMEEKREGEVLGEQVERKEMEGELEINGETSGARVYEYTGGWSQTLQGEFTEREFSATAFPGEVVSFDVVAENIGSATWQLVDRASINVIGGALVNAWAHTTNWMTDLRPDEAGAAVAPGETYTFALEVQAPNTPGVYELPLMLSHDVGEPQFVRFDTGEAVVTITVVATSNGGGSGSGEEDDSDDLEVLGEQIFREDPPENNGNQPSVSPYLGGGGSSSGGGGGSSSGGGGGSSSGGGGSEEGEGNGEESDVYISLSNPQSTPHTTSSLDIVLGGYAYNVVDLIVNGVTSTASSTITSSTWQYPVTLTPDATNTFQIQGVSASGTLTSVITVEILHTSVGGSSGQVVVITEIAWMGTAADYNDEWMEVTNLGDSDVDLTGYQIRWGYNMASDTYSNSLTFPAFTLPSGESTIVERTSQQTVSNVTGTLVYTGPLGNAGDRVQLLDDEGTVVDDVNSTEDGWFAGNNTTKHTMVRYATAADVASGNIPTGWTGWCTWGFCLADNVLEGAQTGLDADGTLINGSPGGMVTLTTSTPTTTPETPNPTSTSTLVVNFAKIQCAEESLLPNWAAGASITSSTAATYAAETEGCYLIPEHSFQWAPGTVKNTAENDVYDEVEDWNTVGPTGEDGTLRVEIDVSNISDISFREVNPVGNYPFTFFANGKSNADDVSAEFYCSVDGKNYDNMEWARNVQAGDELYCVAFNASLPDPEPEGPFATVHFQKIVCEEESLLPNGKKDVVITSTTAQAFVDASEGGCWLEEGWNFQWKEDKIPLSAALDVYGEVNDWQTVGPTDEYGTFTTTIDLTEISHVSVREVLEYGYIPYTYWNEGKNNTDDVTAEFYCSDGAGNNYDNLAWLQDLEDGDERYCVAFNAPVEEPCDDYAYDGSCEEEEFTPEATVHFQKVICEDEALLPNGKKDYEVTADTAQDLVDASEGKCYLAEGWSFQWKDGKIANSESLDVYGELGDWTTVGPTDEYGLYSTIIDLTEIEHISVREVLQEGYIPYTYVANGNQNTDDVTAEFYCSDGAGNNYDNLAWIQNLEDGDERYCVAFNVPEVFDPEGEITSPEDGSTVSLSFGFVIFAN